MPTLPKPTEGSDYTPPPAGTHPATCYRFIDLGTQKSTFNGTTKLQHKIVLSWEITDLDVRMDDGHPFTISQRFTWSMHEKATLRKTLEAWRGQPFTDADFGEGGFNTRKLLGVGCLLSIIHNEKDGKVFGNINGVMKLPNGMTAMPAENPHVFFSLDPSEFDRDVLSKLSDSLQDMIKASPQYQAIINPSAEHIVEAGNGTVGYAERFEEDIPF